MYRYSSEPMVDYAMRFKPGSEMESIAAIPMPARLAVWNAFWLLRPEFERLLEGEPWHQVAQPIRGLLPAIIADIMPMGMAWRFTDHPLNLSDFLDIERPTLRCQEPPYDLLPRLGNRCIETADRLLLADPVVWAMGGSLHFQTVDH